MAKKRKTKAQREAEEAENNAAGGVDVETLDELSGEGDPGSVPDLSHIGIEDLQQVDLSAAQHHAEMSEALGEYSLNELDAFFRQRGFQLAQVGKADPAEDEDEIEKFWMMVEGLPAEDRGMARITVHRSKPLFFQGFETAGYCKTYPLPVSIESIKEELGGGTYKLTLRVDPSERDSTNAPYSRTAMIKIVDPPYPNIGTLSKDEKQQGVTLAPDMQKAITALDEKIDKIADGGNQKQSGMEKAMEAFMITTMKKMADPPPPPAAPEPPTPQTPQEQIESSIGLVLAIQKLGGVLSGDADAGVDPDDDSLTGQAARTVKNMQTIMSGLGDAMREMRQTQTRDALAEGRRVVPGPGAEAPPPAPEAEPTMTAAEQLDAVTKINEAIGILMDHVMNTDKRAKSIAADLNKKLSEIPKRFHKMVQGQLTEENVFQWIEDWIDDSENLDSDGKQKCKDKIRGRNGKKKIQKVLMILRGEDAGGDDV
jgi:hypothetical protein